MQFLPEYGSVDGWEGCGDVEEDNTVLRFGWICRLLDCLLDGGVEREGLVCCRAMGFESTLTKVQFSDLVLES